MMSADDVECNCDGDEEALKAFLLDVGCLDSLSRWTRGINVFEVLGVSRLEIRHSNMLAWLMDPLESHGLGIASFVVLFSMLPPPLIPKVLLMICLWTVWVCMFFANGAIWTFLL